ncbi:hypothetical protein [Xanthobacter dioxanivorans]|uniref:hypothetical protein n=1 Tax=Xanthobacter dioxanivorans TaxID=2528964 RepID=UPI00193383B2|nr:hypothetical protein [Xanthobacter dioxanivorans]
MTGQPQPRAHASGTAAEGAPAARGGLAQRRRHVVLRKGALGAGSAGAGAVGAVAVGALVVGALTVGALAIGALAIGRLRIGRARIVRLEIDELVVGRMERAAGGEAVSPPRRPL